MKFKNWFEQVEKDYDFYKDLLVKTLGIDPENGIFQPINSYDINELLEKINDLGEFKQLPAEIQQSVLDKIKSEEGVLLDVINLMSSR
jgi:hypothetical protein